MYNSITLPTNKKMLERYCTNYPADSKGNCIWDQIPRCFDIGGLKHLVLVLQLLNL